MKRFISLILFAAIMLCQAVCAVAEDVTTAVISEIIVSVGSSDKTVEVKAKAGSGLNASFNGVAVSGVESNNQIIFTYTAAQDERLQIELLQDGLVVDTAECALGRFAGVGKKYVLYVNTDLCDVNGDGISDIKDLVRTNKMVAEAVEVDLAADFGGDGSVTVLDLVSVARVLVSKKAGMPLYTVTYAQKNGKVLQKKLVPQGFGTLPDVSAQKQGYEFLGWSNVAKNVTKDTKIYANYYPEDIYTEWPEGFA